MTKRLIKKYFVNETTKNKIFFKKLLTNRYVCDIIPELGALSLGDNIFGGIAQLARATGSYPVGHRFKSDFRYQARWSSG